MCSNRYTQYAVLMYSLAIRALVKFGHRQNQLLLKLNRFIYGRQASNPLS